jgi:hypothetical protein
MIANIQLLLYRARVSDVQGFRSQRSQNWAKKRYLVGTDIGADGSQTTTRELVLLVLLVLHTGVTRGIALNAKRDRPDDNSQTCPIASLISAIGYQYRCSGIFR